jgi:nitroreductase
MNSKLSLIFARRSVRQYEPRPVPPELVRDLLEAAMAAPSACCKDPWHIVVIRDPKTLAAIAAGLPNGKMLTQAAVGLVVCGDLDKAHDRQMSFLLQDCSAAIQNLLLAAAALGLGACWLGVHPREDRILHLRQLLSLPANIVPVSAIAAGWPDETHPPRTRYRDEAVHQEEW